MPAVVDRAYERFNQLRQRYPTLDRLIRMSDHYSTARGNHLAGSITYFSFLSLFPLLAIAFAILSYVVRYYPDARTQVESFLTDNLPGIVGDQPNQINISTIASNGAARASAGVVGAAGLLYAGLGWLDALREGLRQMWAIEPSAGNIVVKKLKDIVSLAFLGTGVLVAVAGSSLATNATTQILNAVGLSGGGFAAFLLQVVAIVLAVLVTAFLLTLVFTRLPGHRMPWKNVAVGALGGAIGIEIVKQFASLLISGTQENPVYGSYAAIITLLVWFNFMARIVMYAAAWCVVGPVATLEAKVAAEGETLDTHEAAAASEAREKRGDDADVPVAEPYKTTAGAISVTTSGAGHPRGDGSEASAARKASGGDGRVAGGGVDGRGGKPARSKRAPDGRERGGFPFFAGVVALVALRRKAAASASGTAAESAEPELAGRR